RAQELVEVRALERVVAPLARDVIVPGLDLQALGQLGAPRALEAVHALVLELDAEVRQVGAVTLVGEDDRHAGPASRAVQAVDARDEREATDRLRGRAGVEEVALHVHDEERRPDRPERRRRTETVPGSHRGAIACAHGLSWSGKRAASIHHGRPSRYC